MLTEGKSGLEIGAKFGLGARSVNRHRTAHLNPSLVAVGGKREERRMGGLADRMARMVDTAKALTDRLEREGATGLQLAAMTPLRCRA